VITAVRCGGKDRLLKVSTTPTPDGMIRKMGKAKKRDKGIRRGRGDDRQEGQRSDWFIGRGKTVT